VTGLLLVAILALGLALIGAHFEGLLGAGAALVTFTLAGLWLWSL
jgi:hypothetical protein